MIDQSKRPFWIKWGRWVSNHLDCATESILRILSRPLNSGMTILVIALALSVPLTLYILSSSLSGNLSNIQRSSDVSLFFKQDAPQDEIDTFLSGLGEDSQIESILYISSEQAAVDFRSFSGLGDILDALDSNPLPASVLVRPKMENAENLDQWIDSVSSNPLIEYSEFDFSWLSRLKAIMQSVERLVFSLGFLMVIAVILVLGNSIRLEISTRKEEMEVVMLVGGTPAYIARPILYWGLWFGLLSGLMAGVIASIMAAYVLGAMVDLSQLYFHRFESNLFELQQYVSLMFCSAVIGWIAAWLSFEREYSAIKSS